MASTIGTPLIRLARFSPEVPLYAKAESMHPSGSAYDRIAEDVLRSDGSDAPAIVAGSGSLCLAFARAAAIIGRSIVTVCPGSTLPEHLILLGQHPSGLEQSDPALGLLGAHLRAVELQGQGRGVLVHSVRHHDAATAHFATTLGAELRLACRALPAADQPRFILAPVGAGALLCGIRDAFAADAEGPAFVGTVRAASSSVQDGTVTAEALPAGLPDVVSVTDDQAYETRMALARREGLLVGMASAGALFEAQRRGEPAISVVVDAGDRYFSVDRRMSS